MTAYSTPTAQLRSPRVATVYQTPVAIAPADNTQIGPFIGLYVGVTGDVAVVPINSVTPVVFKAVPAGTLLPVAFQGINATSTTATNLVGLG